MSQLVGVNPTEVIEAIIHRGQDSRHEGSWSDGRKLAIVMEGGGLRAAYSAGGAYALGQAGLSNVFDEAYATSAGAMNVAYMLTGQRKVGMSIYFEECMSPRFLSFRRPWKMMDVDFIIDEVVAKSKKLDLQKLQDAPTKCFVALLETRDAVEVLVNMSDVGLAPLDVFRAAMAVPIMYNRTVCVSGMSCVDCGVVSPHPLFHAIQRGCTDILVLSTRPSHFSEPAVTNLQLLLIGALTWFRGRKLLTAFKNRHISLQRVRDISCGITGPPCKVNIATICAPQRSSIGSLTIDRTAIFNGAREYGGTVMEIFGRDPNELDMTLT